MNLFDTWRSAAHGMDVLAATQARASEIDGRQRLRLAALLRAAQRSPLLRALHGPLPADLGADRAAACFPALPVTRKPQLMARFDDWVTDPALRLADLRPFLADAARIAEPWLGRYTVWESSGTSGEPAVFVQDAQAMAVYDALEALRRSPPRPLQRWVDPLQLGERHAFVGAIEGHFASQVSMERLRRLQPWCAARLRSFSILQPLADLVEQLERYRPSVIAAYPTAAVLLADEARAGRLRVRPAEVWTGGETLSPAMRERITSAFGCALRNSYGASEFLAMAWECAQGRLHLNADWVILEAVDAAYRPVPPGTVSHTTLLTNLANHVQPLIRYDLGDQIRFDPARCACGSALPVIEVEGRRDDVLVLAGRGGEPVTLLPLALTSVLEDEAAVYDFQLCQRGPQALLLRLGAGAAGDREALARCRQVLKDYTRRMGVEALSLHIETGCCLPHGRSGKVQRVIGLPAGAPAPAP